MCKDLFPKMCVGDCAYNQKRKKKVKMLEAFFYIIYNLKNKCKSKDFTEVTALKMFDIEEVGIQEVIKFNQSTVQVQQDRVKHILE